MLKRLRSYNIDGSLHNKQYVFLIKNIKKLFITIYILPEAVDKLPFFYIIYENQ